MAANLDRVGIGIRVRDNSQTGLRVIVITCGKGRAGRRTKRDSRISARRDVAAFGWSRSGCRVPIAPRPD